MLVSTISRFEPLPSNVAGAEIAAGWALAPEPVKVTGVACAVAPAVQTLALIARAVCVVVFWLPLASDMVTGTELNEYAWPWHANTLSTRGRAQIYLESANGTFGKRYQLRL